MYNAGHLSGEIELPVKAMNSRYAVRDERCRNEWNNHISVVAADAAGAADDDDGGCWSRWLSPVTENRNSDADGRPDGGGVLPR